MQRKTNIHSGHLLKARFACCDASTTTGPRGEQRGLVVFRFRMSPCALHPAACWCQQSSHRTAVLLPPIFSGHQKLTPLWYEVWNLVRAFQLQLHKGSVVFIIIWVSFLCTPLQFSVVFRPFKAGHSWLRRLCEPAVRASKSLCKVRVTKAWYLVFIHSVHSECASLCKQRCDTGVSTLKWNLGKFSEMPQSSLEKTHNTPPALLATCC